eukprot:Colp12_sorted_trinity150504_noHs@5406
MTIRTETTGEGQGTGCHTYKCEIASQSKGPLIIEGSLLVEKGSVAVICGPHTDPRWNPVEISYNVSLHCADGQKLAAADSRCMNIGELRRLGSISSTYDPSLRSDVEAGHIFELQVVCHDVKNDTVETAPVPVPGKVSSTDPECDQVKVPEMKDESTQTPPEVPTTSSVDPDRAHVKGEGVGGGCHWYKCQIDSSTRGSLIVEGCVSVHEDFVGVNCGKSDPRWDDVLIEWTVTGTCQNGPHLATDSRLMNVGQLRSLGSLGCFYRNSLRDQVIASGHKLELSLTCHDGDEGKRFRDKMMEQERQAQSFLQLMRAYLSSTLGDASKSTDQQHN